MIEFLVGMHGGPAQYQAACAASAVAARRLAQDHTARDERFVPEFSS